MIRPSDYEYIWGSPAKKLNANGFFLVGFGFDGTACFRKGAKLGPDAIREVSYGIEGYSPYLDKDLEDFDNIFDLGNIVFQGETIEESYLKANETFFEMVSGYDLKRDQIRIITLGGEHSISYAPIKKYLEDYDDLVLLHLDAHADLRDGYEGYHYSHASIIRRSLDHFKSGHELIQYGIRSGTKEEYDYMKKNNTIMTSRIQLLEKLEAVPVDRPIYMTLDLDFFDPSFLPGTGTPEAGGEDFHFFIKLMKILDKKNFVGADIVELAPEIDSTGNSSVFATKVLRETILALS